MIELQNICYSAAQEEGRKEILRDVSLTLQENRLTVFTGPNGGGKSTLARLIMGVVSPDGGRILFDGEDITGESVTERARRGIGFAFQHPPRFKGLTVGKILELAGWDPQGDPQCQVLKMVGLCPPDYLGRDIDDSLSGGEVKRIEIATILARRPRFAIFDEPEAGIDLWSFTRLTDTFRRLRQEEPGGGMLIISHQEKIMELADEIVLIADGTVGCRGLHCRDVLGGLGDGDAYCDFTCDKEIRYAEHG